jgi:hypothetical protein
MELKDARAPGQMRTQRTLSLPIASGADAGIGSIRCRAMLLLALSDAAQSTIFSIAVWFVIFPALVTGLIGFAIVQALGEARENREHWKFRRR